MSLLNTGLACDRVASTCSALSLAISVSDIGLSRSFKHVHFCKRLVSYSCAMTIPQYQTALSYSQTKAESIEMLLLVQSL
jgi:hypothetical protein